jgi:hypothetical protein
MIHTPRPFFLAIAVVVSILATPAEAKPKRYKRVVPAPLADSRPGSQQPAHMIQLRSGHWVSSYGCFTDEGHGRYSPCDYIDGGM